MKYYRQTRLGQDFILHPGFICAGGEEGRDSCVGDSGSALMASDTKPGEFFATWKLVGLVSFGPQKCGTENIPGVYSRVRHYIDWIKDAIHS